MTADRKAIGARRPSPPGQREQHPSSPQQAPSPAKPTGELTAVGKAVQWSLGKLHEFADKTDTSVVVGVKAGGWVKGSVDAGAELRVQLEPHQRVSSKWVSSAGGNAPRVPVNVSYTRAEGRGGAAVTAMIPVTGKAPVGVWTADDPLLGNGAGAFITGVGGLALFENGGVGATVSVSLPWLRALAGGKVCLGPSFAVRVFNPALKPLTETLFMLPDKSVADGRRALQGALAQALQKSGVDAQVKKAVHLLSGFLRMTHLDQRFLPAWEAFASQKVIASIGAEALAHSSGKPGKPLDELPLKDLVSAAVEEAAAEWNAVAKLENRVEASIGALPGLQKTMHALEADLKPVAQAFSGFVGHATTAAASLLPSASSTRETLNAVLTSILGDGDLEPGAR